FALSWEAIISGRSLRLLERATSNMARMARKLEATEAYGQYVTPSGLNTGNLSGTNLLSGNPVLSMDAVKTALAQAQTFKIDGKRRPVPGSFTLLVPPALEMTAREIIAVTEITTQTGTGDGAVIAKSG